MSILNSSISYQKYFEEITKIPHGSYNEKALAEYLVNFAKELGLKVVSDDVHNVVIYKDASEGYENHPTIALQAHIDMVDEKNSDVEHDFEKDPLDLYIEDGMLCAKGTTLGADDGAGVAYIMAVLADNTLKHPSLEAIFTTQEEVTMEGAFKLDDNLIKARRLINLDGEIEGISNTTSAGGIDVIFTKNLTYVDNTEKAYTLSIGGLNGGHSGVEINKERGNALKIASRIAKKLAKELDLTLCTINGGLKINAIPREAKLTFTSSHNIFELTKMVNEVVDEINVELEHSDSKLVFTLEEVEAAKVLTKEDSNAILNLIYLMPTGLRHKSDLLDGLTTASENIGIVNTIEDTFTLEISIRGALESYIRDLTNELYTLGEVLGFGVEDANWYPAWDYMEHSVVRDEMVKAYKEVTGNDMVLEGVHAGLECGIFKNKFPDMDIVTFGPNISECHSPNEKLDLASFERTYNFLVSLLEKL